MTVPHAERPQAAAIRINMRAQAQLSDARAREAMAEITAAYSSLLLTIDAPTIAAALGKSQCRSVTALRRAICYILHERYDLGWKPIGRAINRDHTSVMYLVRSARICLARKTNPACVQSNRWIFALTRALDAGRAA